MVDARLRVAAGEEAVGGADFERDLPARDRRGEVRAQLLEHRWRQPHSERRRAHQGGEVGRGGARRRRVVRVVGGLLREEHGDHVPRHVLV